MITNLYFKSKKSVFVPTDIAGCQLWLKADAGITKDGSNYVSQWADQSGNNNHAVQANGSAQPLWVDNGGVDINNKPVIRFDGTGFKYLLQTSQIVTGNSENETVFYVMKRFDASSVMSGLFNSSGFYHFLPFTDGNIYINNSNVGYRVWNASNSLLSYAASCVIFSNTGVSLYLNGGLVEAEKPYIGVAIQNTIIGANIGWVIKGDIVEVIVYDAKLSTSDRQLVENYINTKYAIW